MSSSFLEPEEQPRDGEGGGGEGEGGGGEGEGGGGEGEGDGIQNFIRTMLGE